MKLLVRVTQVEAKRPRWTPEAHRTWIKKVFGNKVFPGSDEPLAAARADRELSQARASAAIARAARPYRLIPSSPSTKA
jgi:hypothetical protein